MHPFIPDFIHAAFVGYEIKNNDKKGSDFNLAIKNSLISEDKKYVEMDVGTWQ